MQLLIMFGILCILNTISKVDRYHYFPISTTNAWYYANALL